MLLPAEPAMGAVTNAPSMQLEALHPIGMIGQAPQLLGCRGIQAILTRKASGKPGREILHLHEGGNCTIGCLRCNAQQLGFRSQVHCSRL